MTKMYISTGEMSIQILCPFLNWIVYLFIIEFQVFFIDSRFQPFIKYMICKYFLPVYGLSFHVSDGVYFLKGFLTWTILKVFIEIDNSIAYVLCFGFWPQGMWNLSFLTGDRTHTHCTGRRNLNHWTAREVTDGTF